MTSTQIWIRVTVLVAALVGVVTTMSGVKSSDTFRALFGGDSTDAVQLTRGEFNLCPTRVESFEVTKVTESGAMSVHYFQEHVKWMIQGTKKFELDPLFMEKWLAEHCELKVDKFINETDLSGRQATGRIYAKYINGKEMNVEYFGNRIFKTPFGVIESEEFEQAFAKLDPSVAN